MNLHAFLQYDDLYESIEDDTFILGVSGRNLVIFICGSGNCLVQRILLHGSCCALRF